MIIYVVDLMAKTPSLFGDLLLMGVVSPSTGRTHLMAVLRAWMVLHPLFLLLLGCCLLRLLLLAHWLVRLLLLASWLVVFFLLVLSRTMM